MGKKSRAKDNRTSKPPGIVRLGGCRPSRSTILFVVGCLLEAYGLSATLYSRWDHAADLQVKPVFHLWAVVVGLLVIVYSVRSTRN